MSLHITLLSPLLFVAIFATGQIADDTKPTTWDLKSCIDYAKKNNIQVQQTQISVQESQYTLQQSKEALYPSLSASSSLGLSSGKVQSDNGDYLTNTSSSNRYSLSANLSLFDGLKNYNTIKQNKLKTQVANLSSQEAENSLVVDLTSAYLNWLYANEDLQLAKRTAETSKANMELSQRLLDAGTITKAEFIQVKAQNSDDLYNVVTAQNTLDASKLSLKQLLELGMDEPFEPTVPTFQDKDIMVVLPSKKEVYERAMKIMPEIKRSGLSVDVAQLTLDKAKGSYYPSLSLSASLSTGYSNLTTDRFGSQLNNNLGESVSLSLSIPIYNQGSTRTTVQKAKLSIESSRLDYTTAQKDLLKTVESLYQDAVAAQNKYQAAKEKVAYTEESYRLIEEEYKLGMKKPIDLLTEKDNVLEAQQSLTQAKYSAILSQKLLNFYQELTIEL